MLAAAGRPIGGWISDKFGGSRVTAFTLVVMTIGALGVIHFLAQKGFLMAFFSILPCVICGSGYWFWLYVPNDSKHLLC
ncbi:hypothetical protein GCM10020331_030230 [Ectobacillus funiculus]